MTAPTRTWDAPAAEVEAHVRELTLLRAARKAHSRSDYIADSHAAWLVTHPDVTYPIAEPVGWRHHIAQVVELNREWEKAAEFNRLYPIGTPVIAYPGFRPEKDKGCTRIETASRSRATVLGGHTAVVWVDGHSSCIALTHIDIRTGGTS